MLKKTVIIYKKKSHIIHLYYFHTQRKIEMAIEKCHVLKHCNVRNNFIKISIHVARQNRNDQMSLIKIVQNISYTKRK